MIEFILSIDKALTDPQSNLFKGLEGNPAEVFRRELDQSAAAILNRLRTTYLAEQDPTGAGWAPSPTANKRKAAGGSGLLFKTGRLYRSIQLVRADSGADERVIRTDVPYAGFHQFGTKRMPKREFLTVTPEHEKLAESIFLNKLNQLATS